MKGRNAEGLYESYGKWCFKYRSADGQWKGKSTGVPSDNPKSKLAAFAFKAAFLNGAAHPAPAQPETVAAPAPEEDDQPVQTLKAAVEDCLALSAINKAKATVRQERFCFTRLLEYFGDDKLLNAFRLADLKKYVIKRRTEKNQRTGKPIGRAVNIELRLLKTLLEDAELWHISKKQYKKLRVKESKHRIGQVLTAQQLQNLLALADSKDQWFTAFNCSVLQYNTGTRGVEVRNLKLEDIHLEAEEPFIVVRVSKTQEGEDRVIPLTPSAQWALRKLLNRAGLLGCHLPNHYLLPLNRSKITSAKDPRKGQLGFDVNQHTGGWGKAWRSLRKAAGLGNFRAHDFRCCFISNMAESGVSADVVRTLAGHLDEAMTQHYQYIQQRSKQNAVAALNAHTSAAFNTLLHPPELTVQ
jgi:integrase